MNQQSDALVSTSASLPRPNQLLSPRFMVANGVHLAVLDRLRTNTPFAESFPEELPAIIREVADEPLSELEVNELFQ